ERREVVAPIRRRAAVREDEALETAIVGFAHRRVHAHVGGDARQDEISDRSLAQDELEVGRAERTLARLVDDGLTRARRELWDDLPASLAAHEDPPARPRIADADAARGLARTPALVFGQIGQ